MDNESYFRSTLALATWHQAVALPPGAHKSKLERYSMLQHIKSYEPLQRLLEKTPVSAKLVQTIHQLAVLEVIALDLVNAAVHFKAAFQIIHLLGGFSSLPKSLRRQMICKLMLLIIFHQVLDILDRLLCWGNEDS